METIDFEELKWGSFTKQFNAYHKKHPRMKSLEQFANYIISNPTQFQPITKKRANFYLNVILKKGGSIETDDFEERGIVSLPEFRSIHLNLPTYMYKRLPDIKGKPPPYRYKLVIPITKARHLSSRKAETSIDLSQKPLSRPVINIDEPTAIPSLDEFSPSDRTKIQEYYYNVKQNDKKNVEKIDKDDYQVVPRGYPLPCGRPKVDRAIPKPVKKVTTPRVVENIPKSSSKKSSVSSLTTESNLPKSKTSSKSSSKSNSEVEFVSSLKSPSELSFFDPDEELRKVLEGVGINKILSNNMPNSWITYVKDYASKNGMNYREALRDPNCKAGYKKGSGTKKGKGVIDESEFADQALLADAYNSTQLGANGGKKFISL